MVIEEYAWVKDVAIPTMGLAIGFLGARLSDWSRARGEEKRRDLDHEAVQLTYDQAQMNTLTARSQALMDGYERRIADLVSEVKDLRDQILQLRIELNARHAATGTSGPA
jgi:uncharacterized membrane-anchored protein YhcB (DUF1043 family)